MFSARRSLMVALVPGLLLPGSLAFQLCFCGLFEPHGAHTGCTHEERCAHRRGLLPHERGRSSIGTLGELIEERCFCVRFSLPRPPRSDRAPDRSLSDSPCDPIGAILADAPPPTHAAKDACRPRPVPGRDRSPLPSSSRTLPLLI